MKQNSSQLPLPLGLGEKAKFTNFLLGNNIELVQAISSAVQNAEPGLLYFYGPKSAGKSHLLFAAMGLASDNNQDSSYLSLADATVSTEMLAALSPSQLVCLDNLEQWAGDKERERTLFTLFEQIKHQHGQLLVSATQPPDRCDFALPDLVSRLASGLLYSLQPLNDEQRFAALKMRAEQRGLSISDDAVRYLLSRASRDSAELFALLDQIDRASLIEQRKITIPFLQSLI